MSDDILRSPLIYDGLDPAVEPKSTTVEVSEVVKETGRRVKGAIEAGRKPGR